jgi:hypothetical protein
MFVDFNSFNKSHRIIRSIDLLAESLGGDISMETIMRVVYFDLEQSNKRRPIQDFSFTKKEMKYAEMPSLSKFTKNNPYLNTKRSSYSMLSNFSLIQSLDIIPQKILMNNLSTNVLTAKQTK